MRITIETSNWGEMQKLIAMLKSMEIHQFSIVNTDEDVDIPITKGDKSINPQALFGIWKDSPRSLEEIRENAWKRSWEI